MLDVQQLNISCLNCTLHITFFPFWVQIFLPNIKCSPETVPDSNDNRFTNPEKNNPGEITVYQNYQMEIEPLQANSIPVPAKMLSILRTTKPNLLPVSWMCASLIGPIADWRPHMHWATELFIKVSWCHIARVLCGTMGYFCTHWKCSMDEGFILKCCNQSFQTHFRFCFQIPHPLMCRCRVLFMLSSLRDSKAKIHIQHVIIC